MTPDVFIRGSRITTAFMDGAVPSTYDGLAGEEPVPPQAILAN